MPLKYISHRALVVFVWLSVWRRHQWRGNGNFCLQSRTKPLLAPSMLCVCHMPRAAGGSDLFLRKWQDPLWKTPRRASKTTMLFLWRGTLSNNCTTYLPFVIYMNHGNISNRSKEFHKTNSGTYVCFSLDHIFRWVHWSRGSSLAHEALCLFRVWENARRTALHNERWPPLLLWLLWVTVCRVLRGLW